MAEFGSILSAKALRARALRGDELAQHENIGAFQWALREAPLLPCFAMAMLSGTAIISQRWQWADIAIGLAALGLSAIFLFLLTRKLLENQVVGAMKSAGVQDLSRSSWTKIANMRRLIIDGVDNLRWRRRSLADHQPRLDPRLVSLMLSLARHSEHPLSKVAIAPLSEYVKKIEPVSRISQGAAGGVMGYWRGHYVMLYAPTNLYGEAQLSLCLSIDGEASASLYFDEGLQVDAAPMLARLKQQNIKCLIYDREPVELLSCAARQLGNIIQSLSGDNVGVGTAPLSTISGQDLLKLAFEDGRLKLKSGDNEKIVMSSHNLAAFPTAINCLRAFRRARERSLIAIGAGHIFAMGLIFAGCDWRLAVLLALLLSSLMQLPIYWQLEQICGVELTSAANRRGDKAALAAQG